MEETVLDTSDTNVTADPQVGSTEPTESPETTDVSPPVDDVSQPSPLPQRPSSPPVTAEEPAAAVSSVVVVEPIALSAENGVPPAKPKARRNAKSTDVASVAPLLDRSRRRSAMRPPPMTVVPTVRPKRKVGRPAGRPRKIPRIDDEPTNTDVASADITTDDPELPSSNDDETVSSAVAVNNPESATPPPIDPADPESAASINNSPTSDLVIDTTTTTITPKPGKRHGGKRPPQPNKNRLKSLDSSLLHHALKVGDNQYQCPICDCVKNHVGHMILHVRAHKDLTRVFELYEKAGGTISKEARTAAVQQSQPTDQPVKLKIPRMKLKGRPVVVVPLRETVGKRLRVRTKKHDLGFFTGTVRQFNRKLKEVTPPVEMMDGGKVATETADEPVNSDPSPPPNQNSIIKVRKYTRRKKPADKLNDTDGSLQHSEETTGGSDGDWSPGPVTISGVGVVSKARKLDGLPKRQATKKQPLSTSSPSSVQNKAKQEASGGEKMSLSRQVAMLLKQDLSSGKVSITNPHICRFCGKVFYNATGLHFHYVKHTRQQLAKGNARKTLNHKPSGDAGDQSGSAKPFDRAEYAFDELVTALKREEQENEAGLLKELGDDVNVLLDKLAADEKVLRSLGWPKRSVGDLLIDILERCDLQPSRERLNIISPLQCLRKNVFELLTFCIKDSVMEENGWDQIDNVDETVKAIIGGATRGYQNGL